MARVLAVAGALVLLGLPVWFMTRGDGVAAPVAAVAKTGGSLVDYTVRLTASAPARLSVMVAGKEPAESGDGVVEFQAVFSMSESAPEDVAVFADFSQEGGKCAVRVEVERGGRVLKDATLWGEGVVDDVVVLNDP